MLQMNLYNIRKKSIASTQPSPLPPPPPPQVVQKKDASHNKSMIWGMPTWYLFHTLAEKVKDEHFEEIRVELLDIISSICNILPCPICRDHAKEYLKQINFHAITNRDKLKWMLFEFHNIVNRKKDIPSFPFEGLQKYETANLKSIIYHFMHVYSLKSYNVKFIADEIYKNNILQKIKGWLQTHVQYFHY
jgi:hypothetical protein